MCVKTVGKHVLFKIFLILCCLFLQDWYQVFLDICNEILKIEAWVGGHLQPWRPTFTVVSWLLLQFCRFVLGWVIGALDNIILIVTWSLRFVTYWRDLVLHWLGLF